MSQLFSLESEQAALGALLFDNNVYWDLSFLEADHFHDPVHALIFDASRILITQGRLASPVSVDAALSSAKGYLDAGGREYLETIASSVPATSGAGDYGRVVRDFAFARSLKATGEEIAQRAAQTSLVDTVETQIAEAEKALGRLAEGAMGADQAKLIADDLPELLEAALTPGDRVTGIPTGLSAFDDLNGGFQPGELVVIAGRPSMGKTALALCLMRACAVRGRAVFFASLEMEHKAVALRFLSDAVRDAFAAPYRDLLARRPRFTDREIEGLREYARVLREAPLVVDCTPRASALQIAAGARRAFRNMKARGVQPGMIVVDYLQLMQRDPSLRSDLAVGENVAEMKALAKSLNAPLILLSQLNRSVEAREDKRPHLGDLRESGNIEEHADIVAFILRPEYYEETKEYANAAARDAALADVRGVMKLFVDKNRNGPKRTLSFDVDIACNAVRDAGALYPRQEFDWGAS